MRHFIAVILVVALLVVITTSVSSLDVISRFDLPRATSAGAAAGKIAIDSDRGIALVIVDSPPLFPASATSVSSGPTYSMSSTVPGMVCRLNVTTTADPALGNLTDCVELRSSTGLPVSAYDLALDTATATAYVVSGSRTSFKGVCRLDNYHLLSSDMTAAVCVELTSTDMGSDAVPFGIALGQQEDSTSSSFPYAIVSVYTTSVTDQHPLCRVDLPSMAVSACDLESSKGYLPFAVAVKGNHSYVTSVGIKNSVLCKYRNEYGGGSVKPEFIGCVGLWDNCLHGSAVVLGDAADVAYVVCETNHDVYSVLFRVRTTTMVLEAELLNPLIAGHAVVLANTTGDDTVYLGTQADAAQRQSVQIVHRPGGTYLKPNFCLNVSAGSTQYRSSIFGLAFHAGQNSLFATQGSSVIVMSVDAPAPTAVVSADVCDAAACKTRVAGFVGRHYYQTLCNVDVNMTTTRQPQVRFGFSGSADVGSAIATIFGIAVGGVLLIAIILAVCVCLWKRRQQAAQQLAGGGPVEMAQVIARRRTTPITISVTHVVAVGRCDICFEDEAEEVGTLQHIDEADSDADLDDGAQRHDDDDDNGMDEVEQHDRDGMSPAENGTVAVRVRPSPASPSRGMGDVSQHRMCKACRERHAKSIHAETCPWCRRKIVVVDQVV